MMDKFQEYKIGLERGGTLTTGSSFVAEIQKEVLPLNIRQPHLESYEGLTGLNDHLACFLNTLQLHNFNDAIMC